MKSKSSLFKTITTIITTTCLTLSVAGGAIAVYALNKNRLPQAANNQNGKEDRARSISSIEKTNSYGLADEYTITYTDNTTSRFVVFNGADGSQGIQGYPGVDGHTPTIEIGAQGTWVVDGVDTGVAAAGPRGQDGRSVVSIDKTNSEGLIDTYTITYSDDTTSTFIVVNGEQGPQGIQGMPGTNGHTPTITISATTGNWVVDGVDTGFYAQGPQGPAGQNGITPHIGQNGNWWIGETDTGVSAQGSQGQQGNPGQNGTSVLVGNGLPNASLGNEGDTYIDIRTGEVYEKNDSGWEKQVGNSGFAIPYIGNNGNWWIGETDTGVSATGPQGPAGRSIVSVEKTYSDGNVDTYTITYSDNTYSYFYVTNGANGEAGAQGVAGTNGHTPEITIGSNGNWFVDGVDTSIKAQGPQGPAGLTPYIGANGNWWIGETDTGVKAQGEQGQQGNPGQNGQTPYIGANGNWWIGETDLGVAAQGPQGQQGNPGQNGNSVLTGNVAPDDSLGNNGDSYINLANYDIYVKEAGEWVLKGNLKGQNGQDGRSIVSIEKTGNNGLIDEYTISYSDGTTSLFYVVNGADGATGAQGIQGTPGANGHTPVIEIGTNGNWIIDGVDTGIKAQGPQGVSGQDGTSMRTGTGAPTDALGQNGDSYIDLDTWNFYVKENGTWSIKGNIKGAAGAQGQQGQQGQAGSTPYIGGNGNWWVGETDTGVAAQGSQGQNGQTPFIGSNGNWWIGETDTGVKAQGPQGEQGQAGNTPFIGANGNWWIGETDTGVKAQGEQGQQGNPGQNGQTPYIGTNGNWWIGDQDLGVAAQGQQGNPGQNGHSVLTGAGVPEADNGSIGDSYIDTTTWDFYVKTDAGWGSPVGNIKGQQGNPGTSVTVVSVIKTDTEGLVDTYTITFSDGTVTTFTVTNGAAGNNGKTLLTGIGAPAVDQGEEGDSYIDVQNWVYYVKTGEGWQNKGSFKGSDGQNGNDGVSITDISYTSSADLVDTYTITFSNGLTTTFTVTNGQNGTNGNTLITGSVNPTTEGVNGDSYLNTTTWEYFVKEADTWVSKGTIKGNDGAAGPAGTNGTSVKTGTGAPADDYGEVGDSYIDIETWNFYVKTDSGWGTPVGNIHNSPNTYTVTFNSVGGSAVDAIDDATEGKTITAPNNPTKDGYYFQGWYTVEGNKWNFEKDVITDNITLIAHWATFKVEDGVLTGCSLENGDIIIPEFFDDQLVTKIGDEVFKGKTGITSVTIPNTVTEIGESAFEGCTGLTSIIIPNSVRTIGDKAFKDCANLAYAYLPESSTNRGINTGLTTIGAYAFQNCGLKAINVPQSVKVIGQGAFETEKGWTVFSNLKEKYSPNATSITIGPDDTYAQDNPNVGDIFIETNNGIVWIYNADGSWHSAGQLNLFQIINSGEGAPSGSADFNEVYLDTLTGNMYVNSISKLESISLPFIGGNADGSNAYLGYIFGASDVSENNGFVPHSLKNVTITGNYAIADNAMENCKFVEMITISGDPSSIGFGAFKDCNSLKSISIPFIGSTPTLPELKYGNGAPSASLSGGMYVDTATQDIYTNDGSGWTLFNNLTAITGGASFAFGHGVPTGTGTFYFDLDTGDLYIYQPSGWMYGANIGDMVPSSATYFTAIFGDDKSGPFNLPYSLTKVIVTKGNGENRDVIPSNAFAGQYSIKEYIISNSIREIGSNAFKGCYELKSITLPNSITKIGDHAFEDCYGLESINLPTSLKVISIGAFMNCNDLQTLYIPEGVTEIGHQAFKECSDLRYVYLPNTLLTIGNEAFADCDDLESIVIPDSVTTIYKYAFVYCSSLKSITLPFIGSDPIGGNDVGDQTMGWLFAGNFPSTLKTITVTMGNGVNRDQIPEEAFANCNDVTTINLPNNIKTIGDSAFQYSGIEFIILPASVSSVGNEAFKACNNLTSIVFQEGANKTFGNQVFAQSTHLKTVVINGPITSIGPNPFTGCTALEYVYMGEGLLTISQNMFYSLANLKTVILPNSVTSISSGAFAGCSSLRAITLPNITSIGDSAFYGCTSLEEIVLPKTVTTIGDRAFYYCTSLVNAELNEGLTSIGVAAFTRAAITNLIIPSSVTNISADAFVGCSNLVSVYMEEGPAISIGNSAFNNCTSLKTFIVKSNVASIGTQIFAGDTALEYAAFGEGLTEVGESLFFNFASLKAVVLPNSVTSIAAQAFYGCTSLETIVIPNNVTKINQRAFSGCTSLENITFGNGLKIILDYAFENCTSLKEVVLPEGLTNLSRGVFAGCDNLESLTVAFIGGSLNAYNTPILTGELADDEMPASDLGSDNSIYIDLAHAKAYRKIDGVWLYQLSIINPNTGDPAKIFTGTNNATPYSGANNGDYYINVNNGYCYFKNGSWYYYHDGVQGWFSHLGYIFLESGGSSPIGQFYTSVPTSLKTLIINGTQEKILQGVLNGVQLETLSIPYVGESPTSLTRIGHIFSPINGNANNSYVPASLKNLSVTGDYSIEHHTFDSCSNIENIVLSGNAPSYGNWMFFGCTGVKSITIHHLDSDLASYLNGSGAITNLKAVILLNGSGENHDEITNSAFSGLSSVETIIIPSNITVIGASAFYNCHSLKNINISEGVTTIRSFAFGNCYCLTSIVVPDSVTTFENGVFSHCENLVYAKLGKGITEIPEYVFSYCYNLSNIEFGDITSIGDDAFRYCRSLVSFVVPNTVTEICEEAFIDCHSLTVVSLPKQDDNQITSIGEGAFRDCYALTYCNISDCSHLTTIEDNTFEWCKSLSFVELPNSVTIVKQNAFYECHSLSYLRLGNSIRTIESNAFMYCNSLTSVNLEYVETIGYCAFEYCTSLSYAKFGDNLRTIQANAFSDCPLQAIVLPNGVTNIGENIFARNNNLQSLTLPYIGNTRTDTSHNIGYLLGNETKNALKTLIITNASSLSSSAVSNCKNLVSITVNNGCSSFGNYVFQNCKSLQRVELPTSLTYLGERIFDGCESLTSIVLPSSITYIGSECFQDCKSLLSIVIPNNVTEIGSRAFNGCSSLTAVYFGNSVERVNSGAFKDCSSLRMVVLNDGLEYIDGEAFRRIPIESIVIPGSVQNIDYNAFSDCQNLAYVYFENGVKSIGWGSFSNCASLKNIVIPESVDSIDSGAFSNCDSLESITLPFVGDKVASGSSPNFGYIFGAYSASSNSSKVPASLKTVVITGDSSIGYQAFMDCYYIETIAIVGHPSSIAAGAFLGCDSLTNLTIPFVGGAASIGDILTGTGDPNELHWSSSSIGNILVNPSTTTVIADFYYGNLDDLDDGTVILHMPDYSHPNGYAEIIVKTVIGTHYGMDTYTGDSGYALPYVDSSTHTWWFNDADLGIAAPTNNLYQVRPIGDAGAPTGEPNPWEYYIDISTNDFYIVAYDADQNNWHYESTPTGNIKTNPSTTTIWMEMDPDYLDAMNNYTMDDYIASLPEGTILWSIVDNRAYRVGMVNEYSVEYEDYTGDTGFALPYIGSNGHYWIGNDDTGYVAQSSYFDTQGGYGTPTSSCYSYLLYIDANTYDVYAPTVMGNENDLYINTNIGELLRRCDGKWYTEDTLGQNILVGTSNPDSALGEIGNNYLNTNTGDVFKKQNAGWVSLDNIKEHFSRFGYTFMIFSNNGIPYNISNVTITEDVNLVSGAFEDVNGLQTINFLGIVESIGDNAFKNCYELTSFIAPIDLISIGDNAFENCYSLQHVDLRQAYALETIGDYAFSGCGGIENIVIPNTVTSIGKGAFMCQIGWRVVTTIDNVLYDTTDPDPAIGDDGDTYINTVSGETFYKNGDTWESAGIIPFAYGDGEPDSSTPGDEYLDVSTGRIYELDGMPSSLKSITLPFIGGTRTTNTYLGYIFGAASSNQSTDYVPETLKTVALTSGNAISSNSFANCKNIETVVVPKNITSIGNNAFENCQSITSFVISGSVVEIGNNAFAGSGLINIRFDSSSQSIAIKDSAFEGCHSLQAVSIPRKVTKIGDNAFKDCASLVTFYMEDNEMLYLGNNAFENCYSLAYVSVINAQIIGDCSFKNCHSLREFIISNVTTDIEVEALAGCRGLTTIYVPDSVNIIDYYVFKGCDNLTSLTIPHVVGQSGSASAIISLFGDDSSEVPVSFKTLTLTGNYDIKAFTLDEVLTVENLIIKTNGNILDQAFEDCDSLKEVRIEGNIEIIGDEAFYDCENLETVTFPDTLKSIGEYAFLQNRMLNKVILKNVESIGESAFEGCWSLYYVHLGLKMQTVGDYAFTACNSLSTLVVSATLTSSGFGTNVFEGCSNIFVHYLGLLNQWNTSGLETIFTPEISRGFSYRH